MDGKLGCNIFSFLLGYSKEGLISNSITGLVKSLSVIFRPDFLAFFPSVR